MGIILKFHAGISIGHKSGRKKESIGKPVSLLKRLASSREALFLPARILRRCEMEQPTRAARAAAVSSSAMKGARGCVIDMAPYISIRNAKSQPKIFLSEMESVSKVLVCSGMGRTSQKEPHMNFLGGWIGLLGAKQKDVAEAAGVNPSYISNICRNVEKRPSIDVFLDISDFLGVSVNDLFKKPPSRADIELISGYAPMTRETLLRKRKQA